MSALILNVDDYEAARYARTKMLRQAGFRVVEAATGEAALALLRGPEPPDVAIVDVRLPDISGHEVARRVKADPETSAVMVLQISAAYREPQDQVAGLESGADAYLVAPVEPPVLVATVRALVRARRAENAVRRAARQWGSAFGAITDGMCVADAEGRVTRHNAAFRTALGTDPDRRRLVEVLAAFGDHTRASAVAEGRPWTAEAEVRERWLRASTMPIRSETGMLEGTVCVVADTTHARQLEHVTQDLLTLEKQLRLAAEHANQAKDAFLAVLSHELRTPLTAMLGWVRMLRSGRLDAATTAHALEVVERNTFAQAQLVEDLLDVSRIVSGKMTLTPTSLDLEAVLTAALDTARPAAAARGLTLDASLGGLGRIIGDAARVQQIMANLLSNAIKFTPEGGGVRVRAVRRADVVEIVVADTGEGIAATMLTQIFEPFRQAEHPIRRTRAGLGLGLAIARNLVELHGGAIEAQSAGRGLGSTFTVRLPVAGLTPEAGDSIAAGPGGANLDGVHVLLVEDDPDTRDVVTYMLRASGAEVTTAATGRAALEALRARPPAVLVSDIGLPDLDGYQLIRMVRRLPHDAGGRTPAIALTAFAQRGDRAEALLAGFDRYVAKPIEATALADAVRELLEERTS